MVLQRILSTNGETQCIMPTPELATAAPETAAPKMTAPEVAAPQTAAHVSASRATKIKPIAVDFNGGKLTSDCGRLQPPPDDPAKASVAFCFILKSLQKTNIQNNTILTNCPAVAETSLSRNR